MMIQYDRDDVRRLIVVTPEGPCDPSEILRVVERQRGEDTWSYGLLYDLRHMTGPPDLAELRNVLNAVASYSALERPRGPVAMLSTDLDVYGAACAYAALARPTLRMEVFRELQDAMRWLAAETRPSG